MCMFCQAFVFLLIHGHKMCAYCVSSETSTNESAIPVMGMGDVEWHKARATCGLWEVPTAATDYATQP